MKKEELDPKMIKLGRNMIEKMIKNQSRKLNHFNADIEKIIEHLDENPEEGLREEDVKIIEELHSYLKEHFM
ncbi:hypothetical protein [Marinifilum flexuosum]|uniref:hypothetical protein n=1 Tax=Marinifilum flexuosum TaxID=1117708 RepID=UPI00249224D3|nr:hypothetical protein [Marinifilum flexuosum]